MALAESYRAQVNLMIRCLPAVAQAKDFALKGGTAINLFYHDMPRLSVDIDLTFLPVTARESALAEIHSRLETIAAEIHKTIPQVKVQLTQGAAPKLLVATPRARVKVEPSTVIRQPAAAS
jgi:Nucleotidyl transferase AbiEii toxin, Type IV TA system